MSKVLTQNHLLPLQGSSCTLTRLVQFCPAQLHKPSAAADSGSKLLPDTHFEVVERLQGVMASEAGSFRAGCMCGKVAFTVTGEPLAQFYCHCSDCSRYHSTHYVEVLVYPDKPDEESHVKLVEGEQFVNSFSSGGQIRHFCRECGTALFNKNQSSGMLGTFPVLLDGYKFQPTMHLHCSQSKAYLKGITDGLPKFKDLPTELGGTGQFAVGKWQREWSNSPTRCASPAPK